MDEKREALEESEIVMAAWNYQNSGFCSHACTVEKFKGVRPKQSGCDKKVCLTVLGNYGYMFCYVLPKNLPLVTAVNQVYPTELEPPWPAC